jgi:hypothetical protein
MVRFRRTPPAGRSDRSDRVSVWCNALCSRAPRHPRQWLKQHRPRRKGMTPTTDLRTMVAMVAMAIDRGTWRAGVTCRSPPKTIALTRSSAKADARQSRGAGDLRPAPDLVRRQLRCQARAAAGLFASASPNVVECAEVDPAIMPVGGRGAGVGAIIEGISRRPHAASAR